MMTDRRLALRIALIVGALMAFVLQWSYQVQLRRLDRGRATVEQATQVRLALARAALASARLASGDSTVSTEDVAGLLDRAHLVLRDWQVGRPGSFGVPPIPALEDTTLSRLADALHADLERYERSMGGTSDDTRVLERSLYTTVAARADSALFFASVDAVNERRADAWSHVIITTLAVFVFISVTMLLTYLAAGARSAAAHTEALRALGEALAAAHGPSDVAEAVRRVAGSALGSVRGVSGLLHEADAVFDIIESAGYPAGVMSRGTRYPNHPSLPAAEAIRSRRVVCVPSFAEYQRAHPEWKDTVAAEWVGAIAVLPLVAAMDGATQVLGAVSFDFASPRTFDASERRFLDAVANVSAQAMQRALTARSADEARADARAQREQLGEILERLPIGVFVLDAAGRVLHRNSSADRILGRAVDDAAQVALAGRRADGTSYAVSAHPLQRALHLDRSIEPESMLYTRPDGTTAFLRMNATPLRLDEGARRVVVVTVEDLSDLQHAQQELLASESRFRSMAEELPVGIYRADADGRIVYLNARASTIFGAPVPHLMEHGWLAMVQPEDREVVVRERTAARSAAPTRRRFSFRIQRHGDQSTRHLVVETVFLGDGHGGYAGSLGVVDDVTDRELLEAQLRQAQKMEAVGRLAGGISHDFNNVLTVISSITEILVSDETLGADTRADVQQIRDATKRAAELTRQLLTFSRQQALTLGSVDVREVCERAQRFIRRVIGEDIEVVVEGEAALPRAHADAGALEQILLNLVVNARDAMPDGGTLTLRTTFRRAPKTTPESGAGDASYVCLEVCDTGTGIDPSIRHKIFDPFFSTKEVGQGTGLGLAMVFGLVQQMQGQVTVDSEPGVGTTFTVLLPTEGASGLDETPSVPDSSLPPHGDETILLVEDDTAVRELAKRALVGLGYTVLDAPDAATALRTADEVGTIDLLLTDVVLPGLSGSALADELVVRRPGLRVLYVSGYTGDKAFWAKVKAGAPIVAKPYTSTILARRVREVLDAAVDVVTPPPPR